eukprot:CAMPEP_0206607748 /NCGR_PEP_ID=MMETSP0325_2-20121206/52443_1 /ASSEMBLY_ACC=CAM_ASM_000347 /TAXON_ID=2866 /ORGANISM="Crypthecodinium cohnii, Strain Seligo" /LENGTH=319 /DNA_ID=CAMNT_0054125037 /DNA_START=42 /DNA_END=1002 /DNA_ORIENTATION=+
MAENRFTIGSPMPLVEVETLKLSEDEGRWISGKCRKALRKVAVVANCKVDTVHTESATSLELTGTTDARRKAVKYIQLLLAQRFRDAIHLSTEDASQDCTVLMIPQEVVGYITGKSGSHLRSLEEEHSVMICYVQVPDGVAVGGRGEQQQQQQAQLLFLLLLPEAVLGLELFRAFPSDTPDDEREALAVTNVLPHGDKGGPHDPLTSFSASSEEARDLHQEALEASEEKADAALDEATAASQATSSALRDALEATDHADEAEEIADIAVMVNLVASAMATIVAFVCYLNYKQWLEVRKERKWCHVMACQEDENNNPARP